MKYRYAFRSPLLVGAVFGLGACADITAPTAPAESIPSGPPALATLLCTAKTQDRTVTCVPQSGAGEEVVHESGRKVSRVILGNQGEYVTLASSNVAVTADTFAFDVTVQNLIEQPLGSTDGTTLDADGVRVFFSAGPTSTGSGAVSVANPDGLGTFTATSQPYFQYNQVLADGATSAARRWKLQFSPEVTNFTFLLYVAAAVPFENGYIDETPYVLTLNPGETRALSGTVRSVTGRVAAGETIDWSTSDATTASVSGSQVTAGTANAFATLTATSGARPAIYTTAVSVCQSRVVTSGTSVLYSIESTDCFSSFGGPSGRPSTNYYADLYRVSLTAGQTITVTMDSGDDLNTYLLLASPVFGFLVAGNDDDPEGTLGVGSRVVYTATQTGVYVIEASTFNPLDTGYYLLEVTIS